ncbi:MAG: hypothetical protein RLZ06_117 [Actinomycetota bacterium]
MFAGPRFRNNGENMKKALTSALILFAVIQVSGCQSPQINSLPEISASKAEVVAHSLQPAGAFDGTYFSALLHNPNQDKTLLNVGVSVVGIGVDDVVVATQDFEIPSLSPDETWVLTTTLFGDTVIKAEIEISDEIEVSPKNLTQQFTEKDFSNSKTSFTTSDNYGMIKGFAMTKVALTIPEESTNSSAIVCAAYFDKSEKFLGGECLLQDVMPGRKNGFAINAFLPPTKPSAVKFFARYAH